MSFCVWKETKMRFSGMENLAEGEPFVERAHITLDSNQKSTCICARNNFHVLQQHVAVLHWGCNSDMQCLLTNINTYDLVQQSGDNYPEFVEHMMERGTFGLEQFTSSDTIKICVTSYNKNGTVSSAAWSETRYALEQDAVAAGASVRSITYKFMNNPCKSRSLSRDEASFIDAVGKLDYNTNRVYKTSVKKINLIKLVDDGKSTFTWKRLVQAYKARPGEFNLMSLYRFAAMSFITQTKACIDIEPHIFRYDEYPRWPLKEEF
jgi:hypothetical protein